MTVFMLKMLEWCAEVDEDVCDHVFCVVWTGCDACVFVYVFVCASMSLIQEWVSTGYIDIMSTVSAFYTDCIYVCAYV